MGSAEKIFIHGERAEESEAAGPQRDCMQMTQA